MRALVLLPAALLVTCAATAFASDGVDVYTAAQLQSISEQLAAKQQSFSAEPLKKYGNHYTMVAFRQETGSAEVHEKEADLFVVVEGEGTLVTGGKLVNAHTTAPGELRGSSISGGETQPVAKGAIIHIPAGVPHQLKIPKGTKFSYFVLKVTGQ